MNQHVAVPRNSYKSNKNKETNKSNNSNNNNNNNDNSDANGGDGIYNGGGSASALGRTERRECTRRK